MKKIIHINRNIIQYNTKHNTNFPVVRIQYGKDIVYCKSVKWDGPSEMIYDPENPLKCGAKLWIETESELEITGECSYDDVQKMKEKIR